MFIGNGRDNLDQAFNGQLDDVRVYNRVLTAEEIRLLANPIALDSGLVGHWSLDEAAGSTTAADSSGQGNDGALTNMDANADWVAGRVGGALDFDGSDDFVNVPAPANLDITGDITIAAWIQRGAGTDYDPILSKDNNAVWDYDFYISTGPDRVNFYSDNTAPQNISSTSEITDTAWHHIAVTRSGSMVTFYIDGIADATATMSGNFASNAVPLKIGCDGDCTSSTFSGQLDDVRIYNRALNEEEIKFLASPCNNPGHLPGTMLYNDGHAVLQYCNGQEWTAIGK